MNYRGYALEMNGSLHTAMPLDGDDFTLTSICQSRVTRAIDALWQALSDFDDKTPIEFLPAPRWIRDWLSSGACHVDLDRAHAGAGPSIH